jgi:thioesterase domain-containing protein
LFFIHPGGGSVFCYVSLARHLGPNQPFYGLQTPGLYDDKEPYTNLQALAAHYVQSIRTIQPEGPYYLGGWCVGGIIAYAMAKQLRDAGQEVALLALLDSAPPMDGNGSTVNDANLFAQFAWDLGRLLGKNLPVSFKIALLGLLDAALPVIGDQPVDTGLVAAFVTDLLAEIVGPDAATMYASLKELTLDEQLQYLIAQVRTANINPPETEQAHLRHLYSIYSGNVRAIHRYVPEPYDGNLTLFLAQDETIASQQASIVGWSKLSNKPLSVYKVPGDHYAILKEPDVENLSSCLGAAMLTAVDNA